MEFITIVFSPTGGTKKVAEIVTKAVAESLTREKSAPEAAKRRDISLMGANWDAEMPIAGDSLCVIAAPSFGGRVPVPVTQRLVNIHGNGAKAVLVVTYGNRAYEDTLLELKDLAEQAGFCCIAAIAAVTEHSIMHRYGQGRPDQEDERQLREFGAEIAKHLQEGEDLTPVSVPGHYPYRAHGHLPLTIKVSSACTGCGICASVCPTGAIRPENPKETDEKVCITCMGCVAACPEHARNLNPLMLMMAEQKMKRACSRRKANECMIGHRH